MKYLCINRHAIISTETLDMAKMQAIITKIAIAMRLQLIITALVLGLTAS